MVRGMRSTSGSRLFANHIPTEDSGVAASVRAAGGIIIGKTNTPAFGWTGVTDNMIFGPTPNPYDLRLTAGGSSGGASVSAATGMAPVNIGTDGGGSLRLPAAFTGTVGFKPSHGRIPDVPPHTHWLVQHYGPVTRSVVDAALILHAVATYSPLDPHSLPRGGIDYQSAVAQPPHRPKVLFTTQLGWIGGLDDEIAATCREAAFAMREVGWQVEERDLAWPDPAPFGDIISGVGLASRVGPFRDRRDDIEPGILAILERVDKLPPHAFYDAYVERNRWCAYPLSLFEDFDLLITPAAASLPFALGQTAPATINGGPLPSSGWSPYLRSFNLTGQPAISLPAGRSKSGLPIGLQMVARRFADDVLLSAAAAFERLRPWPRWTPRDCPLLVTAT